MRIIDLSAGNRAIWFNKKHQDCLYVDKRAKVLPDIVLDTNELPCHWDNQFDLVCWDPPHMNCGRKSDLARYYGHHTTKEILKTLERTGLEAHRVSKKDALMALKWNNHDISLKRVFNLLPKWEPLFGHLSKDGPTSRSQTYWVMLRRLD